MELSRYEDVHGTDLATVEERSEVVIQALIERHLLAQGARSLGISVTEDIIDDRIGQLITDIGSESTFQSWLQENHYTMETFREDLKEEILAAAMIEGITDDVSDVDIHAHARHILVATEEEAAQILDQILAGADFAELAVLYTMDLSTRPAGGDLGWFPRATLTTPGLEEAIFSLSPGDIGDVIASDLGYHVVQLLELEERPLTTLTLTTRYRQAVEDWLETQLLQSVIEVFVTP